MKRERIFLYLTTALLVVAFGAATYVYHLKQQARAILADQTLPPAVERYARIQEALQSSPESPATQKQTEADEPEDPPLDSGVVESMRIAREYFREDSAPPFSEQEWDEILQALERPVAEWSEDDWRRLHTFITMNEGYMDEIRALARELGPVYPLDLSQGYATLLPHLAPLRQMARLFRASALDRAHQGDAGGATEDLLNILRLADRLNEEPLLISQLVRGAMGNIFISGLAEAFPEGQIPPALAREMTRYVQADNRADALAAAWEVERSFGAEYIGSFLENGWMEGRREWESLFGFEGPPGGSLGSFLYTSPLARPWQYMDLQEFTRIMDEAEALFDLPYYEARDQLLDFDQQADAQPASRLFTRFLLPSIHSFHRAAARDQALRQITLLGVALETYANEHGAYPENLNAVQGTASSVDPFTGEPLHYSTDGRSFTLYSTGINLTDEGGVHDLHDGDIVWRGRKQKAVPATTLAAHQDD